MSDGRYWHRGKEWIPLSHPLTCPVCLGQMQGRSARSAPLSVGMLIICSSCGTCSVLSPETIDGQTHLVMVVAPQERIDAAYDTIAALVAEYVRVQSGPTLIC